MIPGIYYIRIEEKDKNENDGSGGASAAGLNDKISSSSSANEPEKKILNPQWKNSDGETINKALVDDEVLICADTSGIADGIPFTTDDSNSYDNYMILRGCLWSKKKFIWTKIIPAKGKISYIITPRKENFEDNYL